MQQIRVGADILQFPDGMDDNAIRSVIMKEYGRPKSSEDKIGRGEAAARTTISGATFGFADELASAMDAGLKKMQGDKRDFSKLYIKSRDYERSRLDAARKAYPIQSFLTEIAGSIPTGGPVLKAVKLTGGGYKANAAGGALLSSIAGAGEAEELEEVPEKMFESGLIGARDSAAFKAAGQAVRFGAKAIKRTVFGRTAQDIAEDVIPAEQAGQLAGKLSVAEKTGRQTDLTDIAGDEVAGFTRLLAKTRGSKNIIDNYMNKRTEGSSRRVINAINKNISSKEYFGNADDIVKARSELSRPLYEKAEAEFPEINTLFEGKAARDASGYLGKQLTQKEKEIGAKFQPFLEDSRIQSAYKKAQKDYGIGNTPITSFKALDGIKKSLDDVSGEAKRMGEGEKAREFTSLKHKLVNFLDDLSPTYKEARKTFAGKSELLEAQEKGLNFNNEFKTAEEIKRYVKDLTPGEKDTFKIGVARNRLTTVGNTPDQSSPAGKIFGKPEEREKLKAIFDTPEEYSNFARAMADEIRIFKTKQRVLGGTRTDINLADEANVIGKAIQGAPSPTGAIINAVADSIKKRYIGLDEKNAKELALTFTNRQKSIDMLLKIAKKAEPSQRKMVMQAISDYLPTLTAAQLAAGEVRPLTQE